MGLVSVRVRVREKTSTPSLEMLCAMYRSMLKIRLTEERLAELLEQKEIGCPTHLYTGQEAIAVGVCFALSQDDYVFGAHRSHGHYLAKGGDLSGMVAEIYGKSSGCARGRGGSMHLLAPEVGVIGTVPIVSATIPIAAGAALAAKLRGDRRVSVAFFGDGAVEEGTFHEAMNLAAAMRLPVIFVCENNFLASHLQLLERRAKDNIVDAATAHGMAGARVDGNDVVAVYCRTQEAVARARAGRGPTFLEFRTYRWRGHVGPALDLDVGVKRREELEEWKKKDPIAWLRVLLVRKGITVSDLEEIERRLRQEFEEILANVQTAPYPDPSELCDFVFKSLVEGEGPR